MNKKELTINGVILRQIDYKDNDAIVSVLCDDGKYYTFFARGIKKHTSKNASALQPFMVSEITFFESNKTMHLLKSAKVTKSLYDQFQDYEKMLMAHIVIDVIADLANMSVRENVELFELLIDSLLNLNLITNELFLSSFLVKALKLSGTTLVYEQCALCNSQSVNYISVSDGGFVCQNCHQSQNINLYSLEILKLFRIINKAKYTNLIDLTYANEDYKLLLNLIYEFYISYSGLVIKNIKQFI